MTDKKLHLEKISQWAESEVEAREGYFLVDLKLLPGNQIKVIVDADKGAAIGELAKMNKTLRKTMDENEIFPQDNYSLEVSSPGLDEPLKQLRQYKKNEGREIEIVLRNGQKKKGILKETTDRSILLVYKNKGRKNKPVRDPEWFTFDQIKTTKVCVGF